MRWQGNFQNALPHIWAFWLVLLLPTAAYAQLPRVKILVDHPGMYTVTRADLDVMGFPWASLDPRRFQMFRQGREVAIRVAGEADGRFDSTDFITFYGTGIDPDTPLYQITDVDVYWLELNGAPGLRMAETALNAPPVSIPQQTYTAMQRLEENDTYISGVPLPEDADRWFWGSKLGPGDSISHPFVVTAIVPGATATVHVRLQGTTDDYAVAFDHHTRVRINSCDVGEEWWDGFAQFDQKHTFPASCLTEGSNTLTLESMGGTGATVDFVDLNWFEISYTRNYTAQNNTLEFTGTGNYPLEFTVSGFNLPAGVYLSVYDLTDPERPRAIGNVAPLIDWGTYRFFDDPAPATRNYLALPNGVPNPPRAMELDQPSNLKSPVNGADYIIITHPELLQSGARLAQHRTQGGLRAELVDVMDIYDEFSDGVTDPAAIRKFLDYAYHNWTPPAPTYVLLMGDATLSFKTAPSDYEDKTYVPTHFFRNRYGGMSPGDEWFVAVNGNDPLPDMMIGRLPVTPATADGVVVKLIAYESQDFTGWERRVQLVADDDDPLFEQMIGEYAALVPQSFYAVDQVKMSALGADGARAALLDNLKNGSLMTLYSGHGAPYQWAFEKILTVDDAPSMGNGDRLSFMVALNCLSGYFTRFGSKVRDRESIAEAFVNTPSGGALGFWATTWLDLSSEQHRLARKLMESVFVDGERSLGAGTTNAQVAALADGVASETVQAFVLFGDPASRLGPDPGGGSNQAHPSGASQDDAGGGGGGCSVSHAPGTWGAAAGYLLCLLLPLVAVRILRRG